MDGRLARTVAFRGVTYVSPGGAMFGYRDARLTVEVLDKAPRRRTKADSIGDFDLALLFRASAP